MAQRFATVVLDCDSTLVAIEGIDELARAHRAEVAALTDAAMRGEVPLEDVYARRLELVRPSREQVAALGLAYLEALVPGAAEAVAELRAAGVRVRIISGGLRPAVLALARHLGLEEGDVAAVDLRFDEHGAYAGFDASSPLARSGGKGELLSSWSGLVPPVLLVGDGASDLEAKPAVDAFLAFTGVVERADVTAHADASARTMEDVVAYVLGDG